MFSFISALIALGVTLPGAPLPNPQRSFDGPLLGREPRAFDRAHEARGDLDGDGHVDCWSTTWSGGSGFGGFTLAVRPRCGSRTTSLTSFSSFGDFISAVVIGELGLPPAFVVPVRDGLYGRTHARCLVTTPTCQGIDPAFEWVLSEKHRQTLRAPSRGGPLLWQPGRPVLPQAEVVTVRGPGAWRSFIESYVVELDPRILEARDQAGDVLGFLTFSGDWLGSELVRGPACGPWQLWTSEHGVAIEDTRRHRWGWLYIGTHADKLRHPSMVGASCVDNTITVRTRGEGGTRRLVFALDDAGRSMGWREVEDVDPARE